jgi:hypothetical protein
MCDCQDCNSSTVPQGIAGDNGWSPELKIFATTCSGNSVVVLRLNKWIGGTGTRPFNGSNEMTDAWLSANPLYLASSGYVSNPCEAVNIKGTNGSNGTNGTNGSNASITIQENDGSPTGSPAIIKFGNDTLTYSTTTNTNDTVTYDPEGDWINIPYSSGDITNSDTNPYYTGTHSTAGDLIVNSFFRPYNGNKSVYTGTDSNFSDAFVRRLKYKINDDKTITICGHLEGSFDKDTRSPSATTINLYDDGINGGVPISTTKFASPNCLLKYNFSPISDFGAVVKQFECSIIMTKNGLGDVLNSKPIIKTFKGLVNLTNSYIQIECLENETITFADYVSIGGVYSIHIIIDHTFAKRATS